MFIASYSRHLFSLFEEVKKPANCLGLYAAQAAAEGRSLSTAEWTIDQALEREFISINDLELNPDAIAQLTPLTYAYYLPVYLAAANSGWLTYEGSGRVLKLFIATLAGRRGPNRDQVRNLLDLGQRTLITDFLMNSFDFDGSSSLNLEDVEMRLGAIRLWAHPLAPHDAPAWESPLNWEGDSLSEAAQKLVHCIDRTFKEEPPPAYTIYDAERDDYRGATFASSYEATGRYLSWKQLRPIDLRETPAAFTFLGQRERRYYLPAYLRLATLNTVDSIDLGNGLMSFMFAVGEMWNDADWIVELSKPQIGCLIDFLKIMIVHDPFQGKAYAEAIFRYEQLC